MNTDDTELEERIAQYMDRIVERGERLGSPDWDQPKGWTKPIRLREGNGDRCSSGVPHPTRGFQRKTEQKAFIWSTTPKGKEMAKRAIRKTNRALHEKAAKLERMAMQAQSVRIKVKLKCQARKLKAQRKDPEGPPARPTPDMDEAIRRSKL